MFVGCWSLMPMLCYQCIDYFLSAVDAFTIDLTLLLIKFLRCFFFHVFGIKLSGGIFDTLFTICSGKTQELDF